RITGGDRAETENARGADRTFEAGPGRRQEGRVDATGCATPRPATGSRSATVSRRRGVTPGVGRGTRVAGIHPPLLAQRFQDRGLWIHPLRVLRPPVGKGLVHLPPLRPDG